MSFGLSVVYRQGVAAWRFHEEAVHNCDAALLCLEDA